MCLSLGDENRVCANDYYDGNKRRKRTDEKKLNSNHIANNKRKSPIQWIHSHATKNKLIHHFFVRCSSCSIITKCEFIIKHLCIHITYRWSIQFSCFILFFYSFFIINLDYATVNYNWFKHEKKHCIIIIHFSNTLSKSLKMRTLVHTHNSSLIPSLVARSLQPMRKI